jgi:hypothetical protein
MKRMLMLCMVFVVSISAFAAAGVQPALAVTQATYYASATGSGSTCSITSPCSLTGVRDKVRTVNSNMTGDIVVYLRAGLYALTSSIGFDYRDSGTNGYKVIWSAYPTENPIISGGQSLSGGWTIHDASKNMYKKTGVTSEFRQLYVNGVLAIRARIPNLNNADTLGSYYEAISGDITNKQYKINKTEISNWAELNKVEMVVQPHWYHNRLRVASFTTDANYAYVSFLSPDKDNAFNKSAPNYASNAYHFENAYELIDAQGEWYLNTTTDTLFYKPRPGELMSTASFTAPVPDVLFNLAGTASNPIHHIEFKGITFQEAGWKSPSINGLVTTQGANPLSGPVVPGAVQAAYGQQLRFIDNTFHNLGGTALKLNNGIKDSQIVGNTFQAIAANGIELRSPNSASEAELSENVLIANNTITRIGQQYTNAMGILSYYVKNVVIEHNDISYTPYMAIQVGGQGGCNCNTGMGSNRIQYNDIHHVMQLHDDGGAIYTLGRQPGTYVYENYIHDITKSSYAMSSPVAGLYMDNYSEFITAEHNVLSNIDTGSGAMLTYEQTGIGAQNNQWVNNSTQDQAVKDQAGVTTGYTEADSLRMNEAFNDGTVGSAPAGWTVTNGSGLVQVANVPSSTNKSVSVSKMVSTTTTTVNKTLPSSLSGIVTVQAWLRAEQTSGWKMAPYVVDSSGVQAVAVAFDGGFIKTYNGSSLTNVQAFTAGTWYDIQIVMDTATYKFDLYVDGIRKITDASFRNPTANIRTLSFGIGSGHTGSFYLDDVKVIHP